MTPMFDELDQELREALASEALPSDGFAERVMARVAETPQQKKNTAPARRWLVSAAACLVIAAALIPLLRSGAAHDKNAVPELSSAPYAADAADTADSGTAEQSAGGAAADRDVPAESDENVQQFSAKNADAMDAALCRVSDTLAQQGYTLTVADRRDNEVQVLLTDASGAAAHETALPAAMAAEGFAAAGDGWYLYEEDVNP